MKTETLLIVAGVLVVAFILWKRMKTPATAATVAQSQNLGPVGTILGGVGTAVGGTITGATGAVGGILGSAASGVGGLASTGMNAAQAGLQTASSVVSGVTGMASSAAGIVNKATVASLVNPIKDTVGLAKDLYHGFASIF